MPSATNYYAFCADYSDMATCLFAIQQLNDGGAFSDYPDLERMLRVFQQSTLLKLYTRAVTILQQLDGVEVTTTGFPFGDFWEDDFWESDFSTGALLGDFLSMDFTNDFLLGYLDQTNTGFSSLFQTILNILAELSREVDELTADQIAGLDAALISVLNAFTEIQAYLNSIGLNPCVPAAKKYQNNSTDVYLQAAGADGSDGVPEGIHLRWSLAGELGSNHLAKGHYDDEAVNPANFNQANDFINITRTPYVNAVSVGLDLQAVPPVINYAAKQWTYTINQAAGSTQVSNRIDLTFTDAALYNQLAGTIDPANDYFNFLKSYNGIIQLQIADKAAYRFDFDFNNPTAADAVLKIQAQCLADVESTTAETVYARQTVSVAAGASDSPTIWGENIQAVSLKMSPGSFIQSFSFETYSDFLTTRNDSDWTAIGNGFSLSLTDQDVFDLLETAAYPVDNHWPQYRDGTTVKVANYHDKWLTNYTDQPSMKQVVTDYMALSETDPRAMVTLNNDDDPPGTPGLSISYVDLLNTVAIDYHLARMLGLGFIDVVTGAVSDQYIYRLTYSNRTGLSDSTPLNRSYMTLPSSKANNQLPLQPAIRPVSYGLPGVSSTAVRTYDSSGYATVGNMRAVSIGREPFNDEIAGYDFFADLTQVDNTNIFLNSLPVQYGIEYRPASQSSYVKPEITQQNAFGTQYYAYDPDFPATGIPEIVLVADDPTSLYIQLEKQSGVHFYAIYGVNWFARASTLSMEVATDDTEFPGQNTLLPPTGIAVQYIQQEDPLLFTSAQEQTWLAGRIAAFPGEDTGLTRIVFNWLDITDVTTLSEINEEQLLTAVKPDKVNTYFNPGSPIEITGAIQNLIAVDGQPTQLQVITGPYTQIDGTVVLPYIPTDQFFRFTNSLLNTPDGQFQVVSIVAGPSYPVITIERIPQHAAVEDTQNPGSYNLQQTYLSPSVNTRFSMVENLSNPENWDTLAESVSLYSFADPANPVIESFTDSEDNVTKNWIGGISAGAVVTPLFSDQNLPTDLPGYYQVAFNQSLAPNPQVNLPYDPANPQNNAPGSLHTPHVEWYQGLIRIAPASGDTDLKLLSVSRIVQTDPLELIIYDAGYQDDPIVTSPDSTTTVPVNYHPGYRTYFFPEPSPAAFNATNILPASGQNSLKTMIGLQTADTQTGSSFTSKVSTPAILLALYIPVPVQYAGPVAASLKVRPDADGDAAFTFDLTVPPNSDGTAANPFGFKFVRLTEEDALDALYNPATITTILTDLAALTTDDNYNQRYFELVNLIFDPNNPGNFRVFDAQPQAYGFPVPDKTGLVDPDDPQDLKIQKYTAAVQAFILPLTLQTPILAFIKTGMVTDGSQPVIRDVNGNLLLPTDPDFNPFPMIRQYTKPDQVNTVYIRFTDYTLAASSPRLYFYAAASVTNKLVAGPLSQFTGPVTILNTVPPEEPVISTYAIVPSTESTGAPLNVTFQLSPTAPYDNITNMYIYRTTDILLTQMLSTMGAPLDVPVNDEAGGGYDITDDFSDMTVVPFGDTLYYRIASIRTIINEFNLPEEILSVGSDVLAVNLIDTINPAAPQLTYTESDYTLSWTAGTNKGTYYLYQQNSKGNWTLLNTNNNAALGDNVQFQLPGPLVKTDPNGNTLYYSFKVRVQNASGLFNLTDNILTV
ncbi:hypothetical protein HDF18_08470 [Mucilaginibacter sp. X5P1]|uniref:hypothetical protein n=1 Tax=Mucilaginibacter sp. X5P1 TaxID=2723088 RepID=UPI0016177D16|nr:hypothetical protein [Mucilaginibacter sp. X5P1]MBB6137691.1 flagellar basal body rod protein FlgC [Mucilaginibacter sp. X5P1]